MVRLLRHRQTKGAVTDRLNLRPPRHILTLPKAAFAAVRFRPDRTLSVGSGAERRWRLVTASPVLVRLQLPLAEQKVHTEFEIALR